MKSLFLYVTMLFLLVFTLPNTSQALTVDAFDSGNFLIASKGQVLISPYVEIVEANTLFGDGNTGTRTTWVKKGVDTDPSIAVLDSGSLSFQLDNDECSGGLKYDFDHLLNFDGELGIAFDISYSNHSMWGAAYASMEWIDSSGNSFTDTLRLGYDLSNYSGTHDGIHLLEFSSDFFNTLDSSTISEFNICFGTGVDYAGIFTIDSIFTVAQPIPEPATIIMFGVGLAGVGFARKRKQGHGSLH